MSQAFSEVDRYAESFTYVVQLVNIVEQAVILPETLLNPSRIKSFQSFMSKALDAISSCCEGSTLDIGDGVKRRAPSQFRSMESCIKSFQGSDGLGYITKFLPDNFLTLCDEKLLDPFLDIKTIPESERLIAHLAIASWAMKGYRMVMRLCLTAEQVELGGAKDDQDGEKMDAWLAEHGVALNHVDETIEATAAFAWGSERKHSYLQVWGKDTRYQLVSPKTMRKSCLELSSKGQVSFQWKNPSYSRILISY